MIIELIFYNDVSQRCAVTQPGRCKESRFRIWTGINARLFNLEKQQQITRLWHQRHFRPNTAGACTSCGKWEVGWQVSEVLSKNIPQRLTWSLCNEATWPSTVMWGEWREMPQGNNKYQESSMDLNFRPGWDGERGRFEKLHGEAHLKYSWKWDFMMCDRRDRGTYWMQKDNCILREREI